MKKKILGSLAVIAVAAVATFNVHVNMNEDNGMNALSLANVEALAQGESGVTIPCVVEVDATCSYTCTLANGQTATCTSYHVKKV